MITNDYESIVKLHQEMILISERPFTWRGFLKVPISPEGNVRIKLKLIAPSYPSLHDTEIQFGKEIAFLRDAKFSEKVEDLKCNTNKVSTFLSYLQSVISTFIKDNIIDNDGYETTNNDLTQETLNELNDILNTSSEIQVYSDRTLSTITLSLNDVTMKLRRSKHGTHPWTIVCSDLPDASELGSFEKNISNLSVATNKLKSQVQILERAWSNLKQIDENCYVLDPLVPKSCHLFRRIYLTPSLSMLIKINALYPMDMPEIKFLGSDVEVELKKELVSSNLHNWDPGCDFIDNMLMLLDIDTFPKKEEVKKETCIEEHRGAITDEECCICFSLESDTEALPDKICDNNKCRRHFHTSCLSQWLQTIAGNHVVFDHIHGSCPNCREDISCYIK